MFRREKEREREKERDGSRWSCLFDVDQSEYQTHLDPLQINGVHDGPLKELHGGEVPFEQPLQLEIWWFPKWHGPDKTIRFFS